MDLDNQPPMLLSNDALTGVLLRLGAAWDETLPAVVRLRALREALRDLTHQHLLLYEACAQVKPAANRGYVSMAGEESASPHGSMMQLLAQLRRSEHDLMPKPAESRADDTSFVPNAETAGAMALGQITSEFGGPIREMFQAQGQLHTMRTIVAAREAGLDDLADLLTSRVRQGMRG